MQLLFVGITGSARSQMAEGLAKRIFGPTHAVRSAATDPRPLSSLALRALQEVGIDITHQSPQALSEVDLANIDWIITLDPQLASLPVPDAGKHLHWPILDPAAQSGPEQVQMEAFRDVRDALEDRIHQLHSTLHSGR